MPDVYAACERFEKLGVDFVKKPDGGSMKGLAFIKDPDGCALSHTQGSFCTIRTCMHAHCCRVPVGTGCPKSCKCLVRQLSQVAP